MISIGLVTCNRLHLLRDVVEKTLANVSDDVTEVIIWNNDSKDGTRDYLDSVKKDSWTVIHHPENIGTNAFSRVFRQCTNPFLLELDDDIIDAPKHWDRRLREAFESIPRMGFLAANCMNDGNSVASEIMYGRDSHLYSVEEVNGVRLKRGPVGGWCSLTSRKIYDEVGGFRENPGFTFWYEDGDFVKRIVMAGYDVALLDDLEVFHASGPYYSSNEEIAAEKAKYWGWRDRKRLLRHRVKLALNLIPGMKTLNSKLGLYTIVEHHGKKTTS